MNNSSHPSLLREIWRDYRSELWFFLALVAITGLSLWLSTYIPDALFDDVITPVLITCTVAVSFFGAWLLFTHAQGIRARKMFGIALIVWGLSDLTYLIGWAAAPKQVMDMGAYELTDYELLIGNLLGWVALLYPTEALRPGWLTWKTAMWQLLPMFALVALDYLIPFHLSPIIAFYPYVLLIFLFTHVRAYKVWCEDNFSTLDNMEVQWIVRYNIMLFLIGINYIVICATHGHARGFTQQWFVIFMFAYSIKEILFRKDPWQNLTASDNDRSNSDNELTSNESERSNSASGLILTQWMDETKPYLNPDFQLKDLRQVLPMNRTYLSRFIRDEFGCTFYRFVNRYRIEEAKRLLREQPDLKMSDIAAQSGFSSPSVFTQTFSKETGLSPREWSKKQ